MDTTTPDLTIGELCALARVSRSTIARRVADGRIPAYRIGTAVRIPRHVLDDLRAGALD